MRARRRTRKPPRRARGQATGVRSFPSRPARAAPQDFRADAASWPPPMPERLVKAGPHAQVSALARPLLTRQIVVRVAHDVVAEREPHVRVELAADLEARAA